MPSTIAKKIAKAKNILLTTHREPDGDGIGAEFALYQGLKKIGKNVRILNPDKPAPKYSYLTKLCPHQQFNAPHDEIEETDIAIVLDTNDSRLVEPLFSTLKYKCKEILFIDHHPVLETGPQPSKSSLIDTKAASTGEVVYTILKELKIPFDQIIAKSIYTSIVFDTQIFKYIRNSPISHKIAAELLEYDIQPGNVHRTIFGDFTKEKLLFVSNALNKIEFFDLDRIAFLKIKNDDILKVGLEVENLRDLIDMIMNIESIEAAILARQDAETQFKLSFRSKGNIEVLGIAEQLGGGGHIFAAGAYVKDTLENIKKITVRHIQKQLQGKKSGTQT